MNGDRWGPVGLGSKHILAFCNLGGATGDDVLVVSQYLQQRVKEELDISLIQEGGVATDVTPLRKTTKQ